MRARTSLNTPSDTSKPLAVQIALEELKEAFGTEFGYDLIDITTNIQKEPWFLAYGSNGRIPVSTRTILTVFAFPNKYLSLTRTPSGPHRLLS